MKIALCFVGHTRTYDQTHHLWNERLLKKYDVDVYVHTYRDRGFFKELPDVLKNAGDISGNHVDVEQLYALYNPVSLVIEDQPAIQKQPILPAYQTWMDTTNYAPYQADRTYWMFKKRQRALKTIPFQHYDRVVLTRFDIHAPEFTFGPRFVNTGGPIRHDGWTADFCIYGEPQLIVDAMNGYDDYVTRVISEQQRIDQIADPHMIFGRLIERYHPVCDDSVQHHHIVR